MEKNILNLSFYKKFNTDLIHLDDNQLLDHYNTIGKYQMRIYFDPLLFKKDKVYIFSTKFGYYISKVIQYILFKNFILSEIIYKIDYNNPNLHIILFSQKVKKFPKNYIIYQLEQKDISKWINKKYELSILFSKITWDYSESNINKFSDIIQKKIIYFPIPLIPQSYLNNNIIILNKMYNVNYPKNNILFFGSMNNIRKNKLNYLQKKLNLSSNSNSKYFIKIINNLYGNNLIQEILNSKIILNIHFYKDAILETCRLNEILSCNRLIISEYPNMIDHKNYDLYKTKVIFTNTMDEMCDNILYYLNNNNYNINIDFNENLDVTFNENLGVTFNENLGVTFNENLGVTFNENLDVTFNEKHLNL